jgi:hypothetical protein
MTEKGEKQGQASVPQSWEPMALTRVGAFSDVLRGSSGTLGDGGATKRP